MWNRTQAHGASRKIGTDMYFAGLWRSVWLMYGKRQLQLTVRLLPLYILNVISRLWSPN